MEKTYTTATTTHAMEINSVCLQLEQRWSKLNTNQKLQIRSRLRHTAVMDGLDSLFDSYCLVRFQHDETAHMRPFDTGNFSRKIALVIFGATEQL